MDDKQSDSARFVAQSLADELSEAVAMAMRADREVAPPSGDVSAGAEAHEQEWFAADLATMRGQWFARRRLRRIISMAMFAAVRYA